VNKVLSKIKAILKSFGPGFIIASVVLGPGSITVASRAGSEYGNSFLWVILVAAFFMIVYTSMAMRFGVSNNNSILDSIANSYGRWFAVIIGISTFLSASSFQFGNNLGIGIGMRGITGIDERIWPLIFTPLAVLLIFFAKNLYKVLEKLMMVLVIIMILAFVFNLVLTNPEPSKVAAGFVPSRFSSHELELVIALVATTFSLNGAIYQSYLAQSKGWKLNNHRQGLNDTYAGISFLAIISIMIVITSATALHPFGIKVNSAADMAIQLEALFGNYARVIFSIGLCAAAFSSLTVNAVIGGGLIADGLGLGKTMNEKIPKIFITLILLLGMSVAVFFKGNVVYALIMAQASSIIAVPFIAIGILLMANKKTMGNLKNNLFQNILAIFGFILICVVVYFMWGKLIVYLNAL